MIKQTDTSDDRYAHLRANAAAQRIATVDKLKRAIVALEADGRPVNTFTIKQVSGLDYMAYYRNAEALALFRTHSTHLRREREKQQAKRHQPKQKDSKHDESLHKVPVQHRDRLLNYKKPELVAKLRAAYDEHEQIKQHLHAEYLELERRFHALLLEHMKCGITIAKLEAQQAELQMYMEGFRSSLRQEEHDPPP